MVSKQNRRFNGWSGSFVRASLVVMILIMGGGLSIGAGQAGNAATVEQSPLYCNVKALSKTEWDRHLQLSSKIGDATVETKELADGYAFRLRTDGVSLAEVAEWTARERRCCPFFDFQIELAREGGPLWFKLTGRDGVKQFILTEFKRFRLK